MNSSSAILARTITCNASKQSYYTARIMVDDQLKDDCYRAYAYFRWVDDIVDVDCQAKQERVSFIARQKEIADRCYRGQTPENLSPEEGILVDLVQNTRENGFLLRSYINHFLAIIAFDAERKGRLISQQELDWYAATLGKAVTDGIQYFVCNGYPYPDSEKRYLAATGAHVVHMLRDLFEDIPDGYINIPAEVIEQYQINLDDLDSAQLREWVQSRTQYAHQLFEEGKGYLDGLTVLRCRIVGYWYCARFEHLMQQIEEDDYLLKAEYPRVNPVVTWLKFSWIGLVQICRHALTHIKRGSEICSFPTKKANPSSIKIFFR